MELKIEGPFSISTCAVNEVDSVTTHYNGMDETIRFPVIQRKPPEFSCGIENMIQRFHPAWCNDRTAEMDEDAEGEWVRLSDVKAILENLENL